MSSCPQNSMRPNRRAYRRSEFCASGAFRAKLFLVRKEFIEALNANQDAFGIDLGDAAVERLADHFDLVQEHNPLLHLVGPISPGEFAVRHVLESLAMLEFLPEGVRFADVGTGAGFPAIPCLIARPDLRGVLIESKEKKSAFLKDAVERLGIAERATVVNKQFAEIFNPGASIICCRALDKFTFLAPKLLRWAGKRSSLLFGGPSLREALRNNRTHFTEKLMPLSEQRYLFIIEEAR